MRPTGIVIADDHKVVLEGLVTLFNGEDDMQVLGTSGNGQQTIALVDEVSPDVLVLDISMPGEGVTGILKAVGKSALHTKVVIYSGMPERQYGETVARFGAHAFVEKSRPTTELIEAVRGVKQGRYYFAGTFSCRPPETSDTADLSPRFTNREMQVFLRLAHGQRVIEIAAELGVSLVTVSTHRKSVLVKLGLSNNAELTRHAVVNGFIG